MAVAVSVEGCSYFFAGRGDASALLKKSLDWRPSWWVAPAFSPLLFPKCPICQCPKMVKKEREQEKETKTLSLWRKIKRKRKQHGKPKFCEIAHLVSPSINLPTRTSLRYTDSNAL
eukprot:scaffold20837_cov128-Skeletonema_marinoi.AAC.2